MTLPRYKPGEFRDPLEEIIMTAAWAGFASWVFTNREIVAEWSKETGRALIGLPLTPIDQMIDEAVGYGKEQRAKDFEDFLFWATENYWGVDEAPKKVREAINARRNGDDEGGASSPRDKRIRKGGANPR